MKLLILDGNSVINRAFFGVKPLTNKEGLFTHAIYGFLNILERMEKEEQPEAVCVAFDLHGPTFRHLQARAVKFLPSTNLVIQPRPASSGVVVSFKSLP